MKLGNWAHATAYVINPFHQSVCLFVYSSSRCKAMARFNVRLFLCSVLGNGLENTFPWQRMYATIEKLLEPLFYIGSMSLRWESVSLFVYPIPLLSNSSVKTFLLQRRIVVGVVFYAVHVVSKESRRLILPRTSCLFLVDHDCGIIFLFSQSRV
jgi:hypothetical protein